MTETTTSASSASEPNATANEPHGYEALTIAQLLNEMEAAHDRLSATHPLRRLLFASAQVIVQQAQAIVVLEKQAEPPRIVLP